MSKNPKISIICSIFNREKYLEQCINSILNQTISDFELILINNGSNDSSGELIERYAKKDSRIITIHNNNGTTYGTALNQGIKLARGEYIGIVESDDWIDKTMYEKLYNKIVEFDADIALCSFKRHLPGKKILDENRILQNCSDEDLFSIYDYSYLLCLNPSIWAKLYKSTFLKNMKFEENCKYCDTPFTIDYFFSTYKIIAVKECLYNYRQNNPNASTANNVTDNTITKIVDAHILAKQKLMERNVYQQFKEEINFHAAYVFEGWYKRCNDKNRVYFLDQCRVYFNDIKRDLCFEYKYFNSSLKFFVLNILKKNYKNIYSEKYNKIALGKIKIYEKIKYSDSSTTKILGITVYKKIQAQGLTTLLYLAGILKSKKDYHKNNISIYFLGIKIFNYVCKEEKFAQLVRHIVQTEMHQLIHNDMTKLVGTKINRALTIQSQHQKVFPKFKGINRGKKIVIIAAGPTLNYYKPIKNAINIGVNKTFKQNIVPLDYLFILDYPNCKELFPLANNYRPNKCKKFYGMLQEENHPYFIPDTACPDNVYRYYVNNSWNDLSEIYNYDLSNLPLPCFFSVSFQAIAFALWTQPSELYLVGCDNDFSKHFDNSPLLSNDEAWIKMHRIRTMDGYNKLKKFTSIYYPDTKIISVNPVGLRGMFEDVYTDEYLRDHKELATKGVRVL